MLLKALCPRVHPDDAPAGSLRPYILYSQIGGRVINPLGNDIPDQRNARMQIEVWADSRGDASALMLAIEDALRTTYVFRARPEAGMLADRDVDLGLYGALQDFSIWAAR